MHAQNAVIPDRNAEVIARRRRRCRGGHLSMSMMARHIPASTRKVALQHAALLRSGVMVSTCTTCSLYGAGLFNFDEVLVVGDDQTLLSAFWPVCAPW